VEGECNIVPLAEQLRVAVDVDALREPDKCGAQDIVERGVLDALDDRVEGYERPNLVDGYDPREDSG
jgi:hypothetical protein